MTAQVEQAEFQAEVAALPGCADDKDLVQVEAHYWVLHAYELINDRQGVAITYHCRDCARVVQYRRAYQAPQLSQ